MIVTSKFNYSGVGEIILRQLWQLIFFHGQGSILFVNTTYTKWCCPWNFTTAAFRRCKLSRDERKRATKRILWGRNIPRLVWIKLCRKEKHQRIRTKYVMCGIHNSNLQFQLKSEGFMMVKFSTLSLSLSSHMTSPLTPCFQCFSPEIILISLFIYLSIFSSFLYSFLVLISFLFSL